ncbi:MAG: 1,4-alpha-glucan branching enzyme, partial [Deltaproteobacteria bacterium]|nr:1,4-alpha-glucan branching enzyme [Deltaproteobacteria bacterium]
MSADDRVTISDTDIYLFAEGTHSRLYDRLGAKPTVEGGATGVRFSVWAPNARQVAVIGDFNGWEHHENPLEAVQSSGIWSGFVPGVEPGARYKFYIHSQAG